METIYSAYTRYLIAKSETGTDVSGYSLTQTAEGEWMLGNGDLFPLTLGDAAKATESLIIATNALETGI
ncbi:MULTISPECIES: hypothetical protein [Streptomyces]|uniref:hypothetical protein n=1 Tax=Streptomyces TaxID=1883 RepID=UPI00160158E2|nr:hypothetical protein [Streptomyces murinus]MBA9050814.1 hypothetical protein [Streptomyces murinus]